MSGQVLQLYDKDEVLLGQPVMQLFDGNGHYHKKLFQPKLNQKQEQEEQQE